MPLAREGRHPGTDAARRLKGRDAEGSFQAGNLKGTVGFHGLSPLEGRTLTEVCETVKGERAPCCEQRWYRVDDALCRRELAGGYFCVRTRKGKFAVRAAYGRAAGRGKVMQHSARERSRYEQGIG